jgi:DNA-directed RNA polymerase subunit RPC12/RpoP
MKCPNCGNTTDFDIKERHVKCDKCGFNGDKKEFE